MARIVRVSPPELAREFPGPQASSKVTFKPFSGAEALTSRQKHRHRRQSQKLESYVQSLVSRLGKLPSRQQSLSENAAGTIGFHDCVLKNNGPTAGAFYRVARSLVENKQ